MAGLAEVDPILAARRYLLAADAVVDLFDDRIGTLDGPPYPVLRLSDPPGDDRNMRGLVGPLLQIEVLGDPDGTPPRPLLRRMLYVVLDTLSEWPAEQIAGRAPTEPLLDPIVSGVFSASGGGWSPEPIATGQRPRYMSTVRVRMKARH